MANKKKHDNYFGISAFWRLCSCDMCVCLVFVIAFCLPVAAFVTVVPDMTCAKSLSWLMMGDGRVFPKGMRNSHRLKGISTVGR